MTGARTHHDLAALEQQGAWQELLAAAQALLQRAGHDPVQRACLLYLIGKSLVALGNHQAALPPLQQSLQGQPAQGHAAYLLGYCLAQHRQWAEALLVLQRSCGLAPQLPDAWYEQGRVALELGREQAALAALQRAVHLRPAWPAATALLQAARVRVACEQSVPAAAAAMRDALLQSHPPEWLLIEWCEQAAAFHLAGALPEARLLWQALAQPGISLQACSHPLPGRLALTALLLLALIEPDQAAAPEIESYTAALRGCLWLPPSTAEQRFWSLFVEPALGMLLASLPACLEGPAAARGRLLLDVLPALEPSGLDSARLYRSLAARIPPAPATGFVPFQRLLGGQQMDPAGLDWLPDAIEAACERLRQAPSDGLVRRLLDQHFQALSALMLDRPNRLVALPGALDQALALRRRAVESLVQANQRFAALDAQPPAPHRSGRRRRWLLLASEDLPQCVLYRVEHKRQQLERLGCSVRVLWRHQLDHWTFTNELLWADVAVVCRLAATHSVLRAMEAARRFGLPVLYDIDDLLFDPEHCPPALATYGGTLRPAVHRRFVLDVPLFSQAMQRADGLIFSTSTLARRWRELFPEDQRPIEVLANLAPHELLAAATPPPEQPDPLTPLRLVFASGTTAHKQAWQEELAPALAVLLERNRSLRLDLLGHVQLPMQLLPFNHRIRCRPYASYASYLRQLSCAQIGLVVLEPGTYTDAKSAIRWMEFSLLGLASVLSPTATYAELLSPGEDVLFARGVDDWVHNVQRLIDDPDLRLCLARAAYAKALQRFQPAQADAFWQPLITGSSPALPRRRRLLVINVFFAPQSIGGATRVAQDQVLQLLQRAGDRYEVTVLCADHGPWQHDEAEQPQLAVDSHGWNGARVVRMALPPRPWRDAHDPAVAAFCRRWFADEGFDLIHAHCLQMLTAAPLQVAAELGIPYLVTLHDGWWLSPRLFLTTVSGRPIDPADPLGHYDDPSLQDPADLEVDRQRRQQLQAVLAGAVARLAVSEAFAAVYRAGGVQDVTVVENDWQPMAGMLSRRGRSSRQSPLRLCYVGGLALHKGYAVLQAALQRHNLAEAGAGACLTVIDATLQPDQSYILAWNGTPVHCCASVPMAAMAEFYAEHDVLIAPSIWPESYGLVTREALSAGLWVVASGIGALADPIEHGVNGHVVPPGDPDALGRVLVQLCCEPRSPKPLREPRYHRQAIDRLIPLYDQCQG
jgi:glycosyltransferase involved in cell wall biosynthesis/tetratricopeptide (TPR) repeat protein